MDYKKIRPKARLTVSTTQNPTPVSPNPLSSSSQQSAHSLMTPKATPPTYPITQDRTTLNTSGSTTPYSLTPMLEAPFQSHMLVDNPEPSLPLNAWTETPLLQNSLLNRPSNDPTPSPPTKEIPIVNPYNTPKQNQKKMNPSSPLHPKEKNVPKPPQPPVTESTL